MGRDVRRSGVRHLIHAGIDPHTVIAFSGGAADFTVAVAGAP